MAGERLGPAVYEKATTPEGAVVETATRNYETKLNVVPVPGHETAGHEARHVYVARKQGVPVEFVTVRPGPGYLGLTKLSRFNAAAAAAAVNDGTGWGHDAGILEATGHNVKAEANKATRILNEGNGMKKTHAIANALEAEETLDNSRIDQIISDVDADDEILRIKPKVVDVFVTNADGQKVESRGIKVEGDNPNIPIEKLITPKKIDMPKEVEDPIAQERKQQERERQEREQQDAIEAELQAIILQEKQKELVAA